MNLQRILPKGSLLIVLVASTALAGERGVEVAASDEVQQGREMIREARVEIIRSELRLTDAESTAFWPVYGTYREETDVIQDRYAAMTSEYLRRYDDGMLSNEYADELIETFFEIKGDLLAVQKKFLPEFREVLPALKVARLFQLENKINAEIDAQMALVIPLVDPS